MTTDTSADGINRAVGMCNAAGLHGTTAKLRALAAERDTLSQQLAEARNAALGAEDALRSAHYFISNGIDLGYIKMPDDGTPDPAHETPGKVRAALDAIRAIISPTTGEDSNGGNENG